jgi:hypothetical protein
MCIYPEDFFIDNVPLLRVASLSSVTTGTCFFNYASAKIYFLDTPTGHTVEVSTTNTAFDQGPNNVTIQGLIIEKYANPAQMGAIGNQYPGTGLIVTNNEVRLNHGVGINVGSSSRVTGNYVHNNGHEGVSTASSSGVLIENNEIAFNNFDGFSVTWDAGGAKFGTATSLTARGNYVHDNRGDGLWCDGKCLNGLYENNIIINNTANGIAHEISHSLLIHNNVIIGNGFGTATQQMLGRAIQVDDSDSVEASFNFIANNYHGINLTESGRTDCTVNGVPFVCDLNNSYIHDNTIVQADNNFAAVLYQNVGNDVYYTNKNNRFVNDSYCLGTSSLDQIYWWLDNYRSQAQWMGYGNDTAGTYLCPAVFISAPSNGATVSGTVTVSAFAAGNSAVSGLRLFVDGNAVTSVSTTYTIPRTSTQAGIRATYSWDTTHVSSGAHTLRVTASDGGGNSSNASITVSVTNP